MFEFLKKFRLSNNDNNIKKLDKVEKNGVNYVCNKSEVLAINNWMNIVGLDGVSFSEILLKLGFDKDRCLWFQIIPSEDDTISFSFQYKDELYEGDRIDLYKTPVYRLHLGLVDTHQIKISNDDYEKIYYIYKNSNGIEVSKVEDYIKENIDDKTYMRRVYSGGFRITINKNLFYNEIRLVCEKEDVLEVNNEDELREYLLNIDDSVSINEVYKKICEISLGNEIDYKKIDLSLRRNSKTVSSITYSNSKEIFYSSRYEYEIFEKDEIKKMIVGDTFIMDFETAKKRDIEFSYNDYRIEIGIRPFDQSEDNDKTIRLRDYMIGLEGIGTIDKLCSDICNKFLVDVDSISYLKVACYYKNELTDLIHIEKGKLLELELNRDGKIIKIDSDGNFLYGYSDEDKKYLVKINEDRVIGYENYMDSGIENDNMGNVMYNMIREAKDEKVRTRKMIDEMLKRDNN